ncbi:hypothetical protein M440DRAFT_1393863 [Trichoderma longibrachiatum ATCC 18648]|uniref:Uncharacterized protein n=1 Tax=Trichoderma longibrachiatum ATCC 18648 TaxID=983965 RepID=A0A2T4BXU7_TRILO|nr:hypothetical protein M440DRAFT_1393863 [Trichoderma longibrachiatum ATCC 18648]
MSYSTHSLKFHTRVDSRVSLTSVGRMPVIAEDSSAIITQPSPPPAALLRPSAMNPQRSITSLPRGPPRPYIVGFMDIPAECKDEGNDDEDEETVVGEKMSKLRRRKVMTAVTEACSVRWNIDVRYDTWKLHLQDGPLA